jgi:hypothetical protein
MRNKAWRRAQQERMINRALQVRVLLGFRSDIENSPRETEEERYLRAKKRANNLAQCSCEMCTGHKRGPFAIPTIAKLRHDVSMRQQMEEVKCYS